MGVILICFHTQTQRQLLIRGGCTAKRVGVERERKEKCGKLITGECTARMFEVEWKEGEMWFEKETQGIRLNEGGITPHPSYCSSCGLCYL